MSKHVIAIALPAAVSTAAIVGDVATRYGPLTIGGEFGNVLSFHGRRLVQGDNRLTPVTTFRMGARDVVLVQETGGTTCPALYYFVYVSASGAGATPAFGTCNALTRVIRKGGRILVTVPGYQGPFEPAQSRRRANTPRSRHALNVKASRSVLQERENHGEIKSICDSPAGPTGPERLAHPGTSADTDCAAQLWGGTG